VKRLNPYGVQGRAPPHFLIPTAQKFKVFLYFKILKMKIFLVAKSGAGSAA